MVLKEQNATHSRRNHVNQTRRKRGEAPKQVMQEPAHVQHYSCPCLLPHLLSRAIWG